MTDEYVSYETARLLKVVGFHETVRHYYTDEQPAVPVPYTDGGGNAGYDDWNLKKDMVTPFGRIVSSAPTQALAMRWLREEKNVAIDLLQSRNQYNWRSEWHFMEHDGTSSDYKYFPTYEQAADDAIGAACQFLITKQRLDELSPKDYQDMVSMCARQYLYTEQFVQERLLPLIARGDIKLSL